MEGVRLSAEVKLQLDILQTEIVYAGHSDEALEMGLISFSTRAQVGFAAGLLRRAGVPEPWRILVTGILLGRPLHSSKDTSLPEMSALIDWLVGGDEDATEPAPAAVKTIGEIVATLMAASALQVREKARSSGKERVAGVWVQPALLDLD